MTPGEEFFTATIDTRGGPVVVGSMTCFDREQPESARILMLKVRNLFLPPTPAVWMICACSSSESAHGKTLSVWP